MWNMYSGINILRNERRLQFKGNIVADVLTADQLCIIPWDAASAMLLQAIVNLFRYGKKWP